MSACATAADVIPWELHGKEVWWRRCCLTLMGNMIQGCGSCPQVTHLLLLHVTIYMFRT
jgi:hypothetical protein